MNFTQAITSNFKRYVDFNGRSARSEYWWWVLMVFIIDIVFTLLEMIVGGPGSSMYGIINGLNGLVSLALFLPGLAVAIRRLHDTNRSGWWVLLVFAIIIGWIFLIVWYATKGTVGDNKFGADPLGGSTGAQPAQTTWAN